MKRIFALTLAISVSACGWPDYQGGGMDEVYDYRRAAELATVNPEFIDPEPEKRRFVAEMLDMSKLMIVDLRRTYGGHLPGRVRTIEIQWDRAARTFKGDMLDDALIDLAELERLIEDLKKRPIRKEPGPVNVSA